MVLISKVNLGVSPMFSTPRVLVRDHVVFVPPDPPVDDNCYLVNADEINIVNAVGSFIVTVCMFPPVVDTSIIIDFLTVTATVGGVEVEIDTLMGSDPNTSLYTDVYPTLYDPTKITADGYDNEDDYCAYIGAARDKILSGCTMVVQYKIRQPWNPTTFIKMGVDPHPTVPESSPSTMITFTNHSTVWLQLWAVSGTNIISDCEADTTVDAINRFAMTVTDTRAELATNGDADTLFSFTLTPIYQPDPFVAVMSDMLGSVIQRIEIYDPLPSTDGLVELSGVIT